MSETRKSRPPLAADQRRRQIIDLLARHLARMPEALAVSSSPEDETGSSQSCQGVTTESLNVSRFRGSAPASNAAHDLPGLHVAESYHERTSENSRQRAQPALEVSAN